MSCALIIIMKIQYSREMQKTLKDEKTIVRNYGKLTKKIIFNLSVLTAADRLGDVPNTSPTRRHKLQGEEILWAIDLSANWRMIIEALDGVEPDDITEVRIDRIEDYH